MFQFSGFASSSYVFTAGWLTYVSRVSPFGHRRINACLQAPRRFSHATTSFIASNCLGIHRMRLFTWPYNPNTSGWSRLRLINLCILVMLSADMFADFCLRTSCYVWHHLIFIRRCLTRQHVCYDHCWSRLFTDFHIVKELLVRKPIL